MDRNQILESIAEEISRLERVRDLLSTTNGHSPSNGNGHSYPTVSTPKKRILSDDARNRIAQAQKRRWAKQRKESAAVSKA